MTTPTMTDPYAPTDLTPVRPCIECQGAGTKPDWLADGADIVAGTSPATRPCGACSGAGHFPRPALGRLIGAVVITSGERTRLRAGRPKDAARDASPWARIEANRRGQSAAYLWRMARFHGGADVTMPILATTDVRGDPYVEDTLDPCADALAQTLFGTHLAAAHRWGHALGMLPAERTIEGLPATAYAGGPTHDATKPAEEAPEAMG